MGIGDAAGLVIVDDANRGLRPPLKVTCRIYERDDVAGTQLGELPITMVEFQRWREISQSVMVLPLPGLSEIELVMFPRYVRLRVYLRVRDIHSGKPINLGEGDELPREWAWLPPGAGEHEFAKKLRELMVRAYTHEVDESIRWANGKHVRNPHAEDGR